ncbi:hypothetical protein C8R46DRAFT_1185041 [Mycena filopes]|nr:hypothetical protein C8R46DRAFT_1185041 [Mycena filopes]
MSLGCILPGHYLNCLKSWRTTYVVELKSTIKSFKLRPGPQVAEMMSQSNSSKCPPQVRPSYFVKTFSKWPQELCMQISDPQAHALPFTRLKMTDLPVSKSKPPPQSPTQASATHQVQATTTHRKDTHLAQSRCRVVRKLKCRELEGRWKDVGVVPRRVCAPRGSGLTWWRCGQGSLNRVLGAGSIPVGCAGRIQLLFNSARSGVVIGHRAGVRYDIGGAAREKKKKTRTREWRGTRVSVGGFKSMPAEVRHGSEEAQQEGIQVDSKYWRATRVKSDYLIASECSGPISESDTDPETTPSSSVVGRRVVRQNGVGLGLKCVEGQAGWSAAAQARIGYRIRVRVRVRTTARAARAKSDSSPSELLGRTRRRWSACVEAIALLAIPSLSITQWVNSESQMAKWWGGGSQWRFTRDAAGHAHLGRGCSGIVGVVVLGQRDRLKGSRSVRCPSPSGVTLCALLRMDTGRWAAGLGAGNELWVSLRTTSSGNI